MHFGENQLSPRSVGISPLSTAHPQFCNTGGCAPRRLFTAASLWPWMAHVVSGLLIATPRSAYAGRHALFRLGFPLAALLYRRLTVATMSHSPDHSTKGTPSVLTRT